MLSGFTLTPFPYTLFGNGCIQRLPELLKPFAGDVLLLTGGRSYASPGIGSVVEPLLATCGRTVHRVAVSGEPSPRSVDSIVVAFRQLSIGCVVAIGGGSVIDTGKAVSAMLHLNESVFEYLEGVGSRSPDGIKVPFIAIPTTAGTGSEATKNAPIGEVGPQGFKKSLRHDHYVPNVALLDPALTVSCPRAITASCGMDAFTQLLESYVSAKASVYTDALAWQGLEMVARALPRVMKDGSDLEARADMCYAAYLSGITLANAGLGLVHGLAGTLGGYFHIPHGMACAALLPSVTQATIRKLQNHDSDSEALSKYARVGALFAPLSVGSLEECQEALVAGLQAWLQGFSIPGLGTYGVKAMDLEHIALESGPKENPGQWSVEDKIAVLRAAI